MSIPGQPFQQFEAFQRGLQNPAQPVPAVPAQAPQPQASNAFGGLSEDTLIQIQARRQQREQEALLANTELDNAERFEQNAMVAEQAAMDSKTAAQQARATAEQTAQLHEQEELADVAQEQEVVDRVRAEDVARTFVEKRDEINNELSTMVGIDVKEISQATDRLFGQNLEAAQADLAETQAQIKELEAQGKQPSAQQKILVGVAALAPLIAGLAAGKPAQGLAAAGQVLSKTAAGLGAEQASQQQQLGALRSQEAEIQRGILGTAQDRLKAAQSVQGSAIDKLKAVDDTVGSRLENVQKAYDNVTTLEEAKQAKVETKKKLKELNATVEGLKKKKLTDTERNSITFAARMTGAEEVFNDLEVKGWDPKIGAEKLPNQMKSTERQKFEQAQRNFLTAVLRKESGAAISESEFDTGAQLYFPQPGDSQEVLKQKKQTRATALASMMLGLEPEVQQVRQTANTAASGLTPEEQAELDQLEKEGF